MPDKEPACIARGTPYPHHTPQGEWVCYDCKRPLVGSFIRPVLPWRHRGDPTPAQDAIELPGLTTTE